MSYTSRRRAAELERGLIAARDSSVLFLDEPTSNLDAVTEAVVHERIFHLFRDACMVSSVHRPHQLSRFDEVAFMDTDASLMWARSMISKNATRPFECPWKRGLLRLKKRPRRKWPKRVRFDLKLGRVSRRRLRKG